MGCGVGKLIVIAVLCADLVAPRIQLPVETVPVETTVWVEPTTVWVPETTEAPATKIDHSQGFVRYRVNGVLPPYEWQWYLWCKLADRGLEWFYPYACAQIYQESNWNQWSDNGRDFGLCQQKGIYWSGRASAAGIPGADIWDVYAQIHVYVWMMAGYLQAAGDNVGRALSMYYLGTDGWSDVYVGWVLKWLDYLEVVR